MRTLIRITFSAAFLLLLVGRFSSASEASVRDEADRHFRHARGMIQQNCKGCGQMDKDALMQGISEMHQAIDMKCGDKLEAHQVLAEGYRTYLSAFVGPGSPELDALIPKISAVYDYLIERHPSDADLLFERAKLSRTKEEKLAGFRKVLDADPNHTAARFAVSYLLLEAGKTTEGLAEFSRLHPNAVKAELYRNTVAALLQQQGHPQEAEQAQQETFTSRQYASRPNN